MDGQNKNLILATALSFLVILVWFLLFPPPEPVSAPITNPAETVIAPSAQPDTVGAIPGTTPPQSAAPDAPRVAIDTPRLSGTISLAGGRIDDLRLKDYRETIDPTSDLVRLLTPQGDAGSYYALHGWIPGGDLTFEDVPGANTLWQLVSGETLSPGQPVTLAWANARGQTFSRTLAVDENYLFTVTQRVENAGTTEVRLAPYGVVARHGSPDTVNFFILHEGVVQMADGRLTEIKYKNMPDLAPLEGAQAETTAVSTNGWIGFTDKYWMTALIPTPGQAFTAVSKYVAQDNIYQTETRLPTVSVAPGASAESTTLLFAGAKEWETIRDYQDDAGIDRFVDSIDWGWFFFLTKPIFTVLHWLHGLIGNMGLAIIGLTLIIKALVLPLAYKSYVSMARMKELQPELEKLKEKTGDDKQKLQVEMMKMYKEKKVNPAAGCLPILIQVPIFFSLYKVIFVTIELRHAPFFGWLNDLSAPDTSSLYNLFGLLPWAAPPAGSTLALAFIGVLPILLGISMWLQQKLNPAPADPTQAAVFAWMPWIFMFMLGSFASGLVIYWIANNTITFVQQFMIMRSHGHRPDIFGNIRSSLVRRRAVAVPAVVQGPDKSMPTKTAVAKTTPVKK